MPASGSGCRACCSCPHTGYATVPIILAIISYAVQQASLTTCHFVNVKFNNEADVGFGFVGHEADSGILTDGDEDDYDYDHDHDHDGECDGWGSNDRDTFFDAKWRAGMAFSYTSSIIGFVAMIIVICTACVALPPVVLKLLAAAFASCALFSGLSLIALSTDFCTGEVCDVVEGGTATVCAEDCDLSAGAGLAIAAIVLFFVTAITAYKIPPYIESQSTVVVETKTVQTSPGSEIPQKETPPGTTTKTESVTPDGKTVIEETVTHPDGSKTVTKTVKG